MTNNTETIALTTENLDRYLGLTELPLRIHADGTGTVEHNVSTPDVYMDPENPKDLDIQGREDWEALDGYSGQWQYSGPVMHESEVIGGGMATDILSKPGVYAAVIVQVLTDDEGGVDDAGWALLRLAN